MGVEYLLLRLFILLAAYKITNQLIKQLYFEGKKNISEALFADRQAWRKLITLIMQILLINY